MNKLLLTVLVLVVTACCPAGDTITFVNPPVDELQQVISDYNAYRVVSGQIPVSQGLSCRLATVPNGSAQIAGTTQTNVGSYTYNGEFNQADSSASVGVNFIPSNLQSLYTSWYVITCTGYMVFGDSNWHQFSLTSDDGSLLSINGSLINNDGNHGSTTKVASKLFQKGVYSFTLQYMQGPGGNQSLILGMDGQVIGAEHFVH